MKKKFIILLLLAITLDVFSQSINDCSSCSLEILKEKQLAGKSLEELALLRNEIFARKGYNFNSDKLSRYFETQNWYKTVNSNQKIFFSEIESKNIELIKSLESKEKTKRDYAIRDLKELKNALNTNNKKILSKYLKKLENTEYYQSQLDELKTTLNYINLDGINWNKNSGLYSIKLDNGSAIYNYSIRFSNETVQIENGMNQHSEIFGDFDDGYSDYQSEDEYQSWYIFKLTPDGILFEIYRVAG